MDRPVVSVLVTLVVLVLAALAAVGGLVLLGFLTLGVTLEDASSKAREQQAALQRMEVEQAAQIYQLRNGTPPPDLYAMVKSGELEASAVHDPWGHPFVYRTTGGAFVVLSVGPDGQPGTSDDITQ